LIDGRRLLARSPSVVIGEFESELVLYDAASRSFHRLNSTGTEVWSLLDKPRTSEEVVAALATRYAGEFVHLVEPDVFRLLSELVALGLIAET
jgi:PqqD family protein of HPr-rel-A system